MEYVQNTAENRANAVKRAVENCETFVVCAQGELKIVQRAIFDEAMKVLTPIEIAPRFDFPTQQAGVLVRKFR